MNFSNLKLARDYEVEEWLIKSLNLSQHQKDMLRRDEVVRWAPFDFYKDRDKEKSNSLWRLTIIFLPLYWLILFTGLPIIFMIKGKWGYNDRFPVIRLYHFWCRKLNL